MAPTWVKVLVGCTVCACGSGCAESALEPVPTPSETLTLSADEGAPPTVSDIVPTLLVRDASGEHQVDAYSYTDETTLYQRETPPGPILHITSRSEAIWARPEHGEWTFQASAFDAAGHASPLTVTASDGGVEVSAPSRGSHVVHLDGSDPHSDVRSVSYIFRWNVE